MNGFEKSRVVFETWRVNVLCSLTRHFKLFSTREYERVPANCLGRLKKCWGVGGGGPFDGPVFYPGGVVIPLFTSCYLETWINFSWTDLTFSVFM